MQKYRKPKKVSLAQAKKLVKREIGTCQGLHVEEESDRLGFYSMQQGELHVQVTGLIRWTKQLIYLQVWLGDGATGRSWKVFDPKTLEEDEEETWAIMKETDTD